MEGYYGRERGEVFDADGWYHTGDLVSVDGDGFFYFRARRGDMIKTERRERLTPRGRAGDPRRRGPHRPRRRRRRQRARSDRRGRDRRSPIGTQVDVEQLRPQLAEHLSAYKVPRRFVVLADDEVPMMSSGKLDLRALKALLS